MTELFELLQGETEFVYVKHDNDFVKINFNHSFKVHEI